MANLCFLAHIGRAAVAASLICRQKTQSHVSKGSDHVLYLSYLKNAFLDQNVMLFHWLFAGVLLVLLRQLVKV